MAERAHGAQFAIATPHVAATDAGRKAFERGGNAVDAALAAASVLTVVYPHMCALGGDVMALVHDGQAHAINGSGRAPQALSRDLPAGQATMRGGGSITVPGAVSAWGLMAERWGSLPFSLALDPAIELAGGGVPVASSLARALLEEETVVRSDPGLAGVFAADGRTLVEGDVLVQTALAGTLERLARSGPDEFYRGETARRLISDLRERGCALALDDLAAHRTDVEPALQLDLDGHAFLTMGANSQGFSLLQVLSAIAQLGLADPLGADAPIVASLFRESALERDRYLADPGAMDRLVESLLTADHVAALAARAVATRAAPTSVARAHGDTVAIVASDASGLAVSLIQSLFWSFGSGLLQPRTGIICHNRGACFSEDPASVNAPGPGKRPLHTLMPVMAAQDGRVRWVAGCRGGHAQPQIHAQLILRYAADPDVMAAVAGPRFVVGSLDVEGRDVYVEGDFAVARDAFACAGVETVVLPGRDENAGQAHAIAVQQDGSFEAASDPRSDGAAACA